MSTKTVTSTSSPTDGIWKFFASVKLTVIVLLTLAATSIVGTLIPQNENPQAYLEAFGPNLYQLFSVLNLFDMYHSWWFRLLLLLLTLNIIICSIDRLSAGWKLIFKKPTKANPARFGRHASHATFYSKQDSDSAIDAARNALKAGFSYVIEQTGEDRRHLIYAEKGRWSRLGVYVVHFSIILLLLGSLIGSIFGFEGFVNIAEGEAVDRIRLRNSNQAIRLPFAIRCDDFDVSFYANGAPKEFRSSLVILEGGQPTLQKDIIVNDPLRYKGINIFQSSYGQLPPEKPPQTETLPADTTEFKLQITNRSSGMTYFKTAKVGTPLPLPEEGGQFLVTEFQTQAQFHGQPIGPAVVGILTPANGQPTEVLLPLQFHNFDKMRGGQFILAVEGEAGHTPPAAAPTEVRYYTGLQVTKDPGVWVVYSGFILMILGCFVTFFMSHQQVLVTVTPKGDKNRLEIAGVATKNKLGIEKKVEQLAGRLKKA